MLAVLPPPSSRLRDEGETSVPRIDAWVNTTYGDLAPPSRSSSRIAAAWGSMRRRVAINARKLGAAALTLLLKL
jgi:hypothetical protein